MSHNVTRGPGREAACDIDVEINAARALVHELRREKRRLAAENGRKRPRGRPSIDAKAYRVLKLAIKAFERNNSHLNKGQMAAKFWRTRQPLVRRLGLKIGSDPRKPAPDWDTLRKSVAKGEKGERSGWQVLVGWDGNQWQPRIVSRDRFNQELLISEAARRALGLPSATSFASVTLSGEK